MSFYEMFYEIPFIYCFRWATNIFLDFKATLLLDIELKNPK